MGLQTRPQIDRRRLLLGGAGLMAGLPLPAHALGADREAQAGLLR